MALPLEIESQCRAFADTNSGKEKEERRKKKEGTHDLMKGLATDSCNSTYGANCTDQYSPYTVGYATRFGATKADGTGKEKSSFFFVVSQMFVKGISIPPWAALTGLGNTGWYIRPEMTAPGFTVSGAPAEWTVGSNFNIGRGEFVVLAMAYPANTQFTINIESVWWQLSGQNIKYPGELFIVKMLGFH